MYECFRNSYILLNCFGFKFFLNSECIDIRKPRSGTKETEAPTYDAHNISSLYLGRSKDNNLTETNTNLQP